MKNPAVVILSFINAPEGEEANFASHLDAFAAATRSEPGCVAFECHQHPKSPGRFMQYEVFDGQAGFEAHATAPHVKPMFEFLQSHGVKPDYDFWNMTTTWRW